MIGYLNEEDDLYAVVDRMESGVGSGGISPEVLADATCSTCEGQDKAFEEGYYMALRACGRGVFAFRGGMERVYYFIGSEQDLAKRFGVELEPVK